MKLSAKRGAEQDAQILGLEGEVARLSAHNTALEASLNARQAQGTRVTRAHADLQRVLENLEQILDGQSDLIQIMKNA